MAKASWVVTKMRPVAPLPTVAVIEVALATVKDAAAMPPKATAVAPVKCVPVRDTVFPAPALVGMNAVMTGGGGMTEKFIALGKVSERLLEPAVVFP